jgi:peptidoglycan/xylan/chitin deacetylase (PgdA/CDA1 family)
LRIGVFRLIETLAQRGIRPTVAANALVLDRVPEVVGALQNLQPCWIAHGLQATELMHTGMDRSEQAQHIARSLQSLQRHTGTQAAGWLSQDWGTTPDTYALLADAGLSYTLDWVNDEQPYWMEAAGCSCRRLLALPLSNEWDDVQEQWMRHIEPADHAEHILQAARTLARECQAHERAAVMGLGLHPWVWGMPSRFKHLPGLLDALTALPGVGWHTSDELFDATAPSLPKEHP